MVNIVFENSEFLWFLIVLVWIIITHLFVSSKVKRKAFTFANFEALKKVVRPEEKNIQTNKISLYIDILLIRSFALTFLILALANPTLWYEGEASELDYVIAIDSSSSMLADDLSPNRFEVAKTQANNFITMASNVNSKLGIVSFAGSPLIVSLLSDDYEKLKAQVTSMQILNIPGTDIGQAIITSVNMLKPNENPGAIILITDGRSTVGVDISEAINYALNNNIIIHTIGIGREEGGRFIQDAFTRLDEEQLKLIADSTGGRFFRAESGEDLGNSLREIIQIKEAQIPVDLSLIFLIISLILITIEWGILNTMRRIIP